MNRPENARTSARNDTNTTGRSSRSAGDGTEGRPSQIGRDTGYSAGFASDAATSSETTSTVSPSMTYTVTLSVTIVGSGTVTSAPAGNQLHVRVPHEFEPKTTVTLRHVWVPGAPGKKLPSPPKGSGRPALSDVS
jgi:hypothetical protein